MDIGKAEEILNEDHYGLEKAKERVLEYLAVQQMVKRLKGPILCLVGPPGVGKTSLGRSIARALGRKLFVSPSEAFGMRQNSWTPTYLCGRHARTNHSRDKTAGTINPVFLLDEIDKMAMDFRGDPASALLEVLDPEQKQHL